jgi:hypothetical protein
MTIPMKLRSSLASAFVVLAWAPASKTSQVSSACRTAPDGSTANLRAYIQNIVSGTDSAKAHSRTAFHLPHVSADRVQIVSYTDTATCRRARAAYVFYVGSDTITTPAVDVLVIRGNTTTSRYIISDYKAHVGEFGVATVTDTSFSFLVTVAD